MKQNNKPSRPATIYRRGKPIYSNQPHSTSNSASDSDSDPDPDPDSDSNDQPEKQQKLITLPTITIQSDTLEKKIKFTHPSQNNSTHPSQLQEPQPSSSKDNVAGSTQSGSDSSSSSASSDEDQQSDDDDDDEEEEEELAPIYKPVFTSKKNRTTVATTHPNHSAQDDPDLAAQRKAEEESLRRKLSSQKLVEQTLIRELAEKEVGQVFPDVDDTDGLDPEAEFESWKLRELTRLKRDREALIQKAKEKEEIEARRALPEALRLKEDIEFAEQTRRAKPKTKQAFLQKYHHKGAFYNDAEILKKHDYNAPTEGTYTKMELLPSVMQVRDFGKMSRSKWTHLSKEDTTAVDAGWYQTPSHGKNPKSGPSGCFKCGQVGHLQRDCGKKGVEGSTRGGQGANKVELGKRRHEEEGRKRGEEANHDAHHPSKRRDYPTSSSIPPHETRHRMSEARDASDTGHRHRREDDRYRATERPDSYATRRQASRRDDDRSRSRRDRSLSPRRDRR